MNLTVRNNWESLTWFVDGKEIEPNTIKKVEVGGEEFKVKWCMRTVSYGDMGHTYEATSPHGYIKKNVFGTLEEFSLSTLLQRHVITVKEMK